MRKHESLPGFRRRDFFWKNAAGRLFLPRITAERRLFPAPRGENSCGSDCRNFLSADSKELSCHDLPKCLPCRRRGFCPTPGKESFHGATQLLRDFLPRAPVKSVAFVTQQAAALRDAAQPPVKSFCPASQAGMERIATQGRGGGNVSRSSISRAPVQCRR